MKESTTELYQEYPIEAPRSCPTLCAHLEGHGGSARMWIAQWFRFKSLESDRVAHGVWVFEESLQTTGTFNQLSFRGLAVREVVARRVQLITEAYTNPQKVELGHFQVFAVSLELRQYVLTKAKGTCDVENLCSRGRGMRGTEQGGETNDCSTPSDDKARSRGRE